jgi:hypothetical protein
MVHNLYRYSLVDFASSTATWVQVEVPLGEGGGLCTSRDVLERVVHDALPRVQAAGGYNRPLLSQLFSLSLITTGGTILILQLSFKSRNKWTIISPWQAAAARHASSASSSEAPPPHVLFIARTYQPAAAVGLALSRALTAVSQLSQLSVGPYKLNHPVGP